jgi:hypothetical protein
MAKRRAGKAVVGAIGAAFGLQSRSLGAAVVTTSVGVLLGHWIDEVTAPVCGRCGMRFSPAT